MPAANCGLKCIGVHRWSISCTAIRYACLSVSVTLRVWKKTKGRPSTSPFPRKLTRTAKATAFCSPRCGGSQQARKARLISRILLITSSDLAGYAPVASASIAPESATTKPKTLITAQGGCAIVVRDGLATTNRNRSTYATIFFFSPLIPLVKSSGQLLVFSRDGPRIVGHVLLKRVWLRITCLHGDRRRLPRNLDVRSRVVVGGKHRLLCRGQSPGWDFARRTARQHCSAKQYEKRIAHDASLLSDIVLPLRIWFNLHG